MNSPLPIIVRLTQEHFIRNQDASLLKLSPKSQLAKLQHLTGSKFELNATLQSFLNSLPATVSAHICRFLQFPARWASLCSTILKYFLALVHNIALQSITHHHHHSASPPHLTPPLTTPTSFISNVSFSKNRFGKPICTLLHLPPHTQSLLSRLPYTDFNVSHDQHSIVGTIACHKIGIDTMVVSPQNILSKLPPRSSQPALESPNALPTALLNPTSLVDLIESCSMGMSSPEYLLFSTWAKSTQQSELPRSTPPWYHFPINFEEQIITVDQADGTSKSTILPYHHRSIPTKSESYSPTDDQIDPTCAQHIISIPVEPHRVLFLFYTLWCMKEAMVKCFGTGFAIPATCIDCSEAIFQLFLFYNKSQLSTSLDTIVSSSPLEFVNFTSNLDSYGQVEMSNDSALLASQLFPFLTSLEDLYSQFPALIKVTHTNNTLLQTLHKIICSNPGSLYRYHDELLQLITLESPPNPHLDQLQFETTLQQLAGQNYQFHFLFDYSPANSISSQHSSSPTSNQHVTDQPANVIQDYIQIDFAKDPFSVTVLLECRPYFVPSVYDPLIYICPPNKLQSTLNATLLKLLNPLPSISQSVSPITGQSVISVSPFDLIDLLSSPVASRTDSQ